MIPNEVKKVINDGVYKCIDDINGVSRDDEKLIPQRCNHRCLVYVSTGRYSSRKLSNVAIPPENTKHVLKTLSNDYSNAF